MEVQVRHALAAVLPNIGNDTVAVFVYAEVLAQPGDDRKHMAKQRRVRLAQCGRRSDMPLGDNEEMDRGLRVDVIKSQQGIILIQLVRGEFPPRRSCRTDNPTWERLLYLDSSIL